METKSNHVYTELADVLEGQLPEIVYTVANTTVWRAGTLMAQEARALWKEMKQKARESEGYLAADFVQAMREDEFSTEWMANCGMVVESHTQRVADLMAFRSLMISIGEEAASLTLDWQGESRPFTYSSVQEELMKDMPTKPSIVEERRIRLQVDELIHSGDLPADAREEAIKELLDRAKEQRENMAAAIKEQKDIILKLWGELERRAEQTPPQEFWDMSADLRNALLKSAISGLDRLINDIRSASWVSDGEYLLKLRAVRNLQKTLTAMMRPE